MTATNHVMTGAVIGAAIHQPWLAVPLALVSHFVCDSIPHFDPPAKPLTATYWRWLAGDLGLAASILVSIWFLHPANVWLILACGVAAASPDLMWLYYTVYKRTPKEQLKGLVRFHWRIQRWTGARFWPIELTWLLGMGALLLIQLNPA